MESQKRASCTHRKYIAAIVLVTAIMLHAGRVYSCTTVVAGKKATKNGAVLFGHNEDDSGRVVVNMWKVPRKYYEAGSVVRLRGGAVIPQNEVTWALTWFQVPGLAFSDYYANEWGVHVASDACPSREDNPDITDGGIGFMLRRIVAERAKTAREGVRIAGDLLDRLGYTGSGRTLVICDPTEAWLVAIAAGKHWVAQRVPDEEVVILPNVYIIRQVDFSDTTRFMFSKDNVRDYAAERGWYDPAADGDFDFAYAYMNRRAQGAKFAQRGYDTRQWRGQQLITGTAVSTKTALVNGLPFSVRPNRQIGVEDFKAILRDHYEGTVYGPASQVRPVLADPRERQQALPRHVMNNPNYTDERTICTPTTQFSTIAELRSDRPPMLGNLLWFCMGRPDCGVYLPLYLDSIYFPSECQNMPGVTTPEKALELHFDEPAGTYRYNAQQYFWICNDLENHTDMFYSSAIDTVRNTWDAFENKMLSMQESIEKTMLNLIETDIEKAALYLDEYTRSLVTETRTRAGSLTRKIKSDYYR